MNAAEKDFRGATKIIDIIGQFENKHGEVFVVYKMKGFASTYVTGDELDWEVGWRFINEHDLIKDFTLSQDERKGVLGLIKAKSK